MTLVEKPGVPAEREMQAALVESDRLYFELGAQVDPLEGATVAWMPGMTGAPAACVVQRLHPAGPGLRPDRWIVQVTDRLGALGCTVARVYLDDPHPALERALAGAGFRRRVEIGYFSPEPLRPGRDDVTLRPVVSEADWTAKHELHAGSLRASDGHLLAGPSWVELERAKCASGPMQAHLLEAGDEVCGAIATVEVDGLLRAKNVFVHPRHRRGGVGAAAMHRVSVQAQEQGCRGTGIFGVDGKPGNALYVHLGMAPIARRFEWSRPMPFQDGGG